ncbi:hypothetical protein C9439_01005 [archaeon SCG-AAA382B04]|nr:hypothetical protein C9439_01005 [archaeon SCG-AAA382B04]
MTCDLNLEDCQYYDEGECRFDEADIPKTVAVDLDNTIFELTEWKGQNHFGKPIEGVKQALNQLREDGFEIIIWTTRFNEGKEGLKNISDLLEKHDIPFDYINYNPYQPPDMSQKLYADYYIDDRAIEFNGDWSEVVEKINQK